MKIYYKITYKTNKEEEIKQTRTTLSSAHFLYRSLLEGSIENIKMEEVSNKGVIMINAVGKYNFR